MPQPTYTWEEVAENNSEKSAYVSIRNKVYDVTKFIDDHPGGRTQLLIGAGRDVTQVFESYHKPSTVKMLDKYYIGELSSNELPIFHKPGEFMEDLRESVDAYFRSTGQDAKTAPWMWVRYVLIVMTILGGFAMQLRYVNESPFFTAIGTVLAGAAAAFIGLMPLHDSSHFCITHSPTVWRYLGALHDYLNGASSLMWAYQHVLGHHPYTNIDGADPDIITAEGSVPDIRRIKKTQTWFARYLRQHLYVPILYCLLAIKTRTQDLTIAFSKMNGQIRLNDLTTEDKFIFYGGKAFFLLYRVIIPSFFLPWTTVLGLLFAADMVTSWWLALSFQVSHVVGEVEWPKPNARGEIDVDWYEMQVVTTLDYATDSWLWTVLTGALNHQTVHHLFPGINQYHYMAITPIVKEVCKKHNVAYNEKPSYWHAISAHINHLWTMGRDDSKRQ